MFAAAVICSYTVYYTVMILMGEKLANVYPQGRLMSIVNMVNIRILISMLLAAPLITVLGIYASHKIAGPILRMERFMDDMASGNLADKLV